MQDANGEYVVIELQGDLESKTEDSMKAKFIGDLYYSKNVSI